MENFLTHFGNLTTMTTDDHFRNLSSSDNLMLSLSQRWISQAGKLTSLKLGRGEGHGLHAINISHESCACIEIIVKNALLYCTCPVYCHEAPTWSEKILKE